MFSEIDTHLDQSPRPIQNTPTIGSRLRKRRRTDIDSSQIETVSKAIKSAPSQSKSPETHRIETGTPLQSLAQAQQQSPFYPESNGNLDQLPSPELDSMESGQMQAEVGFNESEVFGEIIDHAETLEKNYYDQRGSANGSAAAAPDTYVAVDASLHLKIQSLPILDNLVSKCLAQHRLLLLTFASLLKSSIRWPNARTKRSSLSFLNLSLNQVKRTRR
jgi:hypothetical protein